MEHVGPRMLCPPLCTQFHPQRRQDHKDPSLTGISAVRASKMRKQPDLAGTDDVSVIEENVTSCLILLPALQDANVLDAFFGSGIRAQDCVLLSVPSQTLNHPRTPQRTSCILVRSER